MKTVSLWMVSACLLTAMMWSCTKQDTTPDYFNQALTARSGGSTDTSTASGGGGGGGGGNTGGGGGGSTTGGGVVPTGDPITDPATAILGSYTGAYVVNGSSASDFNNYILKINTSASTFGSGNSFDVLPKSGGRPRTPVGIWSWNSTNNTFTFWFPTWYGVANKAEKDLIGSWSLDPASRSNTIILKSTVANIQVTFNRIL
jgi:hypothetical protein